MNKELAPTLILLLIIVANGWMYQTNLNRVRRIDKILGDSREYRFWHLDYWKPSNWKM